MPLQNAANPVVQQLHRLGQQWMGFVEQSDAVLGVWQVDSQETSMIDALPFLEDTEQGIVPSIFLTFESTFADPEKYAYALIEEFLGRISQSESRASLEQGGVNIDALQLGDIKDTRAWLKLLADFADLVPQLPGHFVAYLKPEDIENRAAWLKWMQRLLSLEIPQKIRLMTKEEADWRWFDELAEEAPGRLQRLVPDLDMDQAMRDILADAARQRPDDPAVQFRQYILETGQAAGEQQMAKAESAAARALALASKQGWRQLEIAVHFTLANGYIGIQDFEQALSQYGQAQAIAQSYMDEAPDIAAQLSVQAVMGSAGCHLAQRDLPTAAEQYAAAATAADEADKPHLGLEAWRMAGFCCQQERDYQQAWTYNRLAWTDGEKLAPETRPTTTLPYVAQALLDLRSKAGAPLKQYQLEDEISALLGADWQTLLNAVES